MTRSTANGDTTWLASTTQAAPAWLKLTRSGSTVNGYVSANGTTWTQIGTTSLAFGPSPIGALIVTSHDTTQLNTSTFDNVSTARCRWSFPLGRAVRSIADVGRGEPRRLDAADVDVERRDVV
jgi:hypothetical protein